MVPPGQASRLEAERSKLLIQSQELQIWDMAREEELQLLRVRRWGGGSLAACTGVGRPGGAELRERERVRAGWGWGVLRRAGIRGGGHRGPS